MKSLFVEQLDPLWCSWLAGFLDGEGYFQSYIASNKSIQVQLNVTLRADDLPVLTKIQSVLACGNIYVFSRDHEREKYGRNANSQARWRVGKRKDIVGVIIPILDRYPLKSKKHSDYLIWREIVLGLYRGVQHTEQGYMHLLSLCDELVAGRKYREPEQMDERIIVLPSYADDSNR
ncbi:MAG: LAGLIDADG family homing endonuclease [Kiritimatiellae bacterium]|nr:LAGLIDADG family homing endonuclease [Kiritimatiellia bacterium]